MAKWTLVFAAVLLVFGILVSYPEPASAWDSESSSESDSNENDMDMDMDFDHNKEMKRKKRQLFLPRFHTRAQCSNFFYPCILYSGSFEESEEMKILKRQAEFRFARAAPKSKSLYKPKKI